MAKGFWTCRRVTHGERCGAKNPNRRRKCSACEKPRPARRRPAHLKALALTYEEFIELNGGEFCGICGRERKSGERRLHRDHDHRFGIPRGLCCFRCNGALRSYMTLEWLEAAAAYLRRAEARR